MSEVEEKLFDPADMQQESLTGFPAVVQSLAPELTVEQAAFEHIHHRDVPHGGVPVLKEFVSSYIGQRAHRRRETAAILHLAAAIYDHAATLAYDYPDNLDEINRRVVLWSDVFDELRYRANKSQLKRLNAGLDAQLEAWNDTYRAVLVGACALDSYAVRVQ